jgi:membrane protease YdiL (CAAX protease family)
MTAFGKFLAYLAATIVLSAIVAPWLYHAGHAVGRTVPFLGFLAETDFVRYFTRSFLIVAVALLWPVVKWIRVSSVADLGLKRNDLRWRDLLIGVVVPFVALWIYGAVLLAFGFYTMKDELPWHRLPAAIGTAIAVAFVEEAFFRGGLFGILRRSMSFRTAAILLSVLFAILHFLKPPEGVIAAADVGWDAGFRVIPQVFSQFSDPTLLLAGCTTLFLISLILCHATAATQSLWLAIGLHAGLVFGARSFSILAQRRQIQLPWVGEDLRIGLLPLIVLAGIWCVIAAYLRFGRRLATERAFGTDPSSQAVEGRPPSRPRV